MSIDEKIASIYLKFNAIPLSALRSSEYPQLVCGRIMPAAQIINCPVKEKPCK